jgi:hypothetical protein
MISCTILTTSHARDSVYVLIHDVHDLAALDFDPKQVIVHCRTSDPGTFVTQPA